MSPWKQALSVVTVVETCTGTGHGPERGIEWIGQGQGDHFANLIYRRASRLIKVIILCPCCKIAKKILLGTELTIVWRVNFISLICTGMMDVLYVSVDVDHVEC